MRKEKMKSLGCWILIQKKIYKNKSYIMKNDIIYNKFKDFLEKYKDYFLSNEDIWNANLEKVIKYIDVNNKLPSKADNNKEQQFLYKWLCHQTENYKIIDRIMKNNIIYNKFKYFMETYKEYFIDNKTLWIKTLEKVKKYININKKKPYNKCKSFGSLGQWIDTQKRNYKIKKYIMKDPSIFDMWTKFIEEYKEYFIK